LGFGRDEQADSFHQKPGAHEAKESQHSNDARVRKPVIQPITESAEGGDGNKRSADADVFYSFEANRPHSLPEEILHEFGGLSAAETLAEQIGRHLQGRIAPQHFRSRLVLRLSPGGLAGKQGSDGPAVQRRRRRRGPPWKPERAPGKSA
jgi:hypothetical protein